MTVGDSALGSAMYEAAKMEERRMVAKKLDQKFYGEIRKAKDDSVVPDDQYLVFLAKDTAFANILPHYVTECRRLGCDNDQLAAVERMVDNVKRWRAANPSLCKIPDARGEKLIR